MFNKKIIKAVHEFFQYDKKGDEDILNEALDKIEYRDKYVIINEDEKIKVNSKKDTLGVFLANIPYIILGNGELHTDLPEKVLKVQNDALKLLNIGGFNEIATLEIYLVMEMALRSLYSEWLSKANYIVYKDKKYKIKGKNLDYRKLKLLLKRKGWSKYKVKINNQIFPYSQGSLLAWAEKYMDRKTSLAFRLSINVRNLLAHGEVEWKLYPTLNSLYSASHASWLLFEKLRRED
ncbi:hypothetical protein DFR86_01555 [Acidianus sulfidivorans JP7]|uniref:Uncharacterized protein n=1 Tax=Acidianus sulfidivorans JP7 TaxID=619593 RepID=A0A2U9IJZ5_9CREN|nr:hypothetical protein [Acidianus sulfidivorans]AWR96361.1 hypothetical protein DFR86_01555 [Acidianus sulfidivorans JP7]